VTVLIASAAVIATRVRVNFDCDDIFSLPLFDRLGVSCGSMPLP